VAALISGAEENHGLYRACRRTSAAEGIVKGSGRFAIAEDVDAASLSDPAKE